MTGYSRRVAKGISTPSPLIHLYHPLFGHFIQIVKDPNVQPMDKDLKNVQPLPKQWVDDDDQTQDMDARYVFLILIFSIFLYSLLMIYSYLWRQPHPPTMTMINVNSIERAGKGRLLTTNIGYHDYHLISSWAERRTWKRPSHAAIKHSISALLGAWIVPCPSTTSSMRFIIIMSNQVGWRTLKMWSHATRMHLISVLLATWILSCSWTMSPMQLLLKVMIKHLKLHLLYLLLYFYHIRKDPAIKRTSYLKLQSMITYISVLTLLLSCVPCTFNFRMRYSSLVCHALRALDT